MRMEIDAIRRVDSRLLDQLRVEAPTYLLTELERAHLVQHRGGAAVGYLVARSDRGQPVGLLPYYFPTHAVGPSVDPAALFDPPLPVAAAALGLAGSAGAYANFLTLSPWLPPSSATLVATSLVQRAVELALDQGCSHLLVPYLTRSQASHLERHQGSAAAVGRRDKGLLPVRWRSFDDYLQWLPAHRRRRVRHERRRFDASGIEVRETPLMTVAGELAPLLTQTENRYGRMVTAEQMEFYLAGLAMGMADDTVTLVAYRDGRPVAFSLALLAGERWVVRAWGCDYGSVGREGLYFNLVYYELLVRAMARGAALLDFGVGALEAKSFRGCTLEPLESLLLSVADLARTGREPVVAGFGDATPPRSHP